MCNDNNPKVQICSDEPQKLLATASKLSNIGKRWITILINSFRNNDKKKTSLSATKFSYRGNTHFSIYSRVGTRQLLSYRLATTLPRFRSIRRQCSFFSRIRTGHRLHVKFASFRCEYPQHVCKRSRYMLNTAGETKQTDNISISI